MPLTFLDVKNLVAEYAGKGGKCVTSPEVNTFAREVLEYLLLEGKYGSIRSYSFYTQNGCFTAPAELETITQVKINGRVGTSWNKWCEFYSISSDIPGCVPAPNVLSEQPNYVATAYDVPPGGSLLGVRGLCEESEDSYFIVQGKDVTGREIITSFNGEQIVGEKFRIKKNEIRYGSVIFGEITAVIKPQTNGYVQLYAVQPDSQNYVFLGDYSPIDEKPWFKKYKVSGCSGITHVNAIGKIRLRNHYTDQCIVPFESSVIIKIAAQRLQAEENNQIDIATHKRNTVKEFVTDEAESKKTVSGSPINVFHATSPGVVKGIIGGRW